jgi:hypothetical protein
MCILLILSCYSMRNYPKNEIQNISDRFLIITADDFGASKNINEGIEFAADKKAITAISVLTNFKESLRELKQISIDHPDIGIGVHLNIITGNPVLDASQVPSLVNSSGRFYTIDELLPKIKNVSPDDLKRELRAQIIALTGNKPASRCAWVPNMYRELHKNNETRFNGGFQMNRSVRGGSNPGPHD